MRLNYKCRNFRIFAEAENRVRNFFSRKIRCEISHLKMPIKWDFFGIILRILLQEKIFFSSQIIILKKCFLSSFYYSALLLEKKIIIFQSVCLFRHIIFQISQFRIFRGKFNIWFRISRKSKYAEKRHVYSWSNLLLVLLVNVRACLVN